jgi:hypothetical protein
MRYKEFKPHSTRKQDTAPQTAKIAAIKKRVEDDENHLFSTVPAHMQAGFDYDDEQWGRQIEHELGIAKKRYLQSLLNDAKRQQPASVLKDEKKNRGLVANMAKRATRKKR